MSTSSSSPTPPKGSVRSIISIFENQTITVNSEPVHLIRRAKSMGSLNEKPTIKITQRSEPEDLELAQIEQQIRHLQNTMSNKYHTYSRDNHIYYQNQIIFILTDLGSVETNDKPDTIDRKSDLTESLKRLNKKLNALLPSGDGKSKTVKTSVNYGVRSRSIEKVVTNVKEPVQERIVRREKVVTPVVKREEIVTKVEKIEPKIHIEEKKDEVDSAAISVKSLKELFEKNTNETEGKTEYGVTKISKKFLTFNSAADFKYTPFSQKYKSSGSTLKKQDSSDIDSTEVDGHLQVFASDDEEKVDNFTPDSLSNEGSGSSSSSEDSGDELNGRADLDDEID